jgi:hypothetical protein
MEAAELRARYTELLVERTRSVSYPSKQLMDRTELGIVDRDKALEYAEELIRKANTRFPSLELIDRINRVLTAIERSRPDDDDDDR